MMEKIVCEICHVCMCLCFEYFNDDSYRNWQILLELFNVALGIIMQLHDMGTNVLKGCNFDHFIHKTNCSFPSNRRL